MLPMQHDFAEYLLENYRRGMAGEPYLPGYLDKIHPVEAVQTLESILPGTSKVKELFWVVKKASTELA
jgi:hypothetical protein